MRILHMALPRAILSVRCKRNELLTNNEKHQGRKSLAHNDICRQDCASLFRQLGPTLIHAPSRVQESSRRDGQCCLATHGYLPTYLPELAFLRDNRVC